MSVDRDRLRELASKATARPWVVYDMDEAGKMKDEPLNAPGEGWYWVWAKDRLPFYGGVLEPEKHHPDCGAAIGEARIEDGTGGKQEQADAEYIAEACNAIPELLDDLDAAERERDYLRRNRDAWFVRAERAEAQVAAIERWLAERERHEASLVLDSMPPGMRGMAEAHRSTNEQLRAILSGDWTPNTPATTPTEPDAGEQEGR